MTGLGSLDVDAFFNALANSSLPSIGNLDTSLSGNLSGKVTLSGWFLDGNGVNTVAVLIDGKAIGNATYGDSRPDVAGAYPAYNNSNAGYHYSLDTTTLTNGTHTLVIQETGKTGQQFALPGVTISVNNVTTLPPKGNLDTSLSSSLSGKVTLSGWFLDGNGVNTVAVLVDGKAIGNATYGDSRPDVAAAYPAYNNSNAGYHYSLDTTALTNGMHILLIQETGKTGQQTALSGVTISVIN